MTRGLISILVALLSKFRASATALVPLLAFVLLVGGPGCGGGASGTGIDVSGKLLEVNSNEPIANAEMRLDAFGLVVKTDENGNFSFGSIPAAASYLITANIDGVIVSTSANNIPPTQSRVFLLVKFNREDENLTVTVIDPDKNDDVAENAGREDPLPKPRPTPSPANPVTPDPLLPSPVPTATPFAPDPNIPGPSPSATPTPSVEPTRAPVPTPEPTAVPTSAPTPSVTATPTPSPSPAPSPTPNPTPELPTDLAAPTVDAHPSAVNVVSFLFSGQKPTNSILLTGSGDTLPTAANSTTWSATFALTEGANVFEIYAQDPSNSSRKSTRVQFSITRNPTGPLIRSLNIVPVSPTAYTFEVMLDQPAGVFTNISEAGSDYDLEDDLFIPTANSPSFRQTPAVGDSTSFVYSAGHSSKYFLSHHVKFHMEFTDYSSKLTTVRTIYFDTRLLQPHPLAPSKLFSIGALGGPIQVRAAEQPTIASTPLEIPASKPASIAIDPIERQIFWIEELTNDIRRSTPSRATPTVVRPIVGEAQALGLDQLSRKLYWAEQMGSRVLLKRGDIRGSAEETIADLSTLAIRVNDIAVDPIRQKIFWACSQSGRIGMTPMGGGASVLLLNDTSSRPERLAIDIRGTGKLFWTDSAKKTIQSANLDGSSGTVILALEYPPRALAIDLSENALYWSELVTGVSGTLKRMLLGLPQNIEQYNIDPSQVPNFLAITKATYRVSGTIKTGTTPKAGYRVYLAFSSDDLSETVTTDSAGQFSYENLPFGTHFDAWAVNGSNTLVHSLGGGTITQDYDIQFDTNSQTP